MKIYFAPLEGVTGHIYRNAYEEFYGKGRIDKYFVPFISPNQTNGFTAREQRDMNPDNNVNMPLAVQIMTNRADLFINAARLLYEKGYTELNLNLGCPMATVVSKKKGSGFIEDPERLDRFFDAVFEGISKLPEERSCKVSVKTRIGVEFPEEFADILRVYNRYPISEVIIHPRLQKDFYNNHPNLGVFAEALKECVHPVCYNGDIFMVEDYHVFREKFPQVDRIMLGRGVIANPGLVREIRTGQSVTTAELKEYHDRLYAGYREEMDCERDALFKMKEVWFYLGKMFPEAERELKKVKKAERPEEYLAAVRSVFTLPVHALQ